jgi:tetratricopeptide (TPR) repeat protein
MLLAATLLAIAQSAAPAPAQTVEGARLDVCLDKARTDPTTAISEASQWEAQTSGADTASPRQCLGMAYTALLRWEAAERMFLSAREALPADDHFRRAQLAAMAGNAALAEQRGAAATMALNLAVADAESTGDGPLQAIVQIDLARALVLQQDEAGAGAALAKARALDPQSPYAFLLSATLARRQGDLAAAQGFIQTAATLAPDYPETGLEAGVIAMLDGREDAAKASWESVIATDPGGEVAATARDYLAQLGETPAP